MKYSNSSLSMSEKSRRTFFICLDQGQDV